MLLPVAIGTNSLGTTHSAGFKLHRSHFSQKRPLEKSHFDKPCKDTKGGFTPANPTNAQQECVDHVAGGAEVPLTSRGKLWSWQAKSSNLVIKDWSPKRLKDGSDERLAKCSASIWNQKEPAFLALRILVIKFLLCELNPVGLWMKN